MCVCKPEDTKMYTDQEQQRADVHAWGCHKQLQQTRLGNNKDPGYRIPGLFVSTEDFIRYIFQLLREEISHDQHFCFIKNY
jgi:hypothetical protein